MKKCAQLFWEFFKISLFVVGGGYAIIAVADHVFGKKLKWLEEGELVGRLPVFQMVPGLIAGNTAIYVGLKVAGRTGAVVALAAVALPSFAIFLGVSCGYSLMPLGNEWVESAMFGLRSALTGVVAGTLAKGWKGSVKGAWGYAVAAASAIGLCAFGANVVAVLLAAMAAGVGRMFLPGAPAEDAAEGGAGVKLEPLGAARAWGAAIACLAMTGAVAWFFGDVLFAFLKFGLLGFGGGFVLVPVYMNEFVGPAAPHLRMGAEEFSNLMALTQTTPGPVSVNAATYFGYRLAGAGGAAVATAALLAPSLFLLTAALAGMEKWKRSRIVRGILHGVRPATNALMFKAMLVFGAMSVWRPGAEGGLPVSPVALALAAFAGWNLAKGRLSIMCAIFLCAAAGCAAHALGGL